METRNECCQRMEWEQRGEEDGLLLKGLFIINISVNIGGMFVRGEKIVGRGERLQKQSYDAWTHEPEEEDVGEERK